MTENDYYPAWLSDCILNDTFPWQAAHTVSMPDFLAQYTLHDSPWIGFWFGNGEPMAVIRWDTFWQQERLSFPGSEVAQWPILVIKFARVYQYLIAGKWDAEEVVLGEQIALAESYRLEDYQREALLAASFQLKGFSDDCREQFLDETLHHTLFTGTYRHPIHLLHGGKVQVLCLNRAGEVLPIPGLGE